MKQSMTEITIETHTNNNLKCVAPFQVWTQKLIYEKESCIKIRANSCYDFM
jgi:hypothetical protein